MHLVFEAFNLRPLLDIRELATLRQDWRDSFSGLGSLPVMNMVVSLAKRTIEPKGRASWRPFMKAGKTVGQRTEPCGTPDKGKAREE